MSQTTISIVSIGQAAAFIQTMPNRIRAAAEALGISPAMRINNIPHYAESDLERIAEFIRNQNPRTQESWKQSL